MRLDQWLGWKSLKFEFTWWTLSMNLYSPPLPLDVMFKQITRQPISLLAALEIVTLFVKNRTFKQMQVIPLSKNSAKKKLIHHPSIQWVSGRLLMNLQSSSENALEQRRSPTSQWFSRYFNFLQKKGVAGIASRHLVDTWGCSIFIKSASPSLKCVVKIAKTLCLWNPIQLMFPVSSLCCWLQTEKHAILKPLKRPYGFYP